MNSHEFVFSLSARDSFQAIIQDMQQVSLLSAERVRSRIMHKLHLIQHQPMQSSKKVDIGLVGHFRVTTVLNFKVFYQVHNDHVLVVDILTDKSPKSL